MAGVQKINLNNLNINIKNATIIGIIIGKNNPRVMQSKKKNGESRGVTSFTLRDSAVDTINAEVWGSEYFVFTFYERFLVGDVVEISSPKISIKTGQNDAYRPHVTSPFYLTLNEGLSDVSIHSGADFSSFLPLLHIPTKPPAGYYGLEEILKLPGVDMTVRAVEVMDNTTPAPINLDIFDLDTIQRAEEWRPLESVLFISDARISWRGRAISAQICMRSIVTHQPHTADAEALRLYARNQANMRGGEAAAWAAWSGDRPSAASVAQLKDRLANAAPFCASLHAMLMHIDLDDVLTCSDTQNGDIRIRLADHTGELTAWLPIHVVEDCFGYPTSQLKSMSLEERLALRWKFLLEQCNAKMAASPPRLMVLSLQRASPADSIPLY